MGIERRKKNNLNINDSLINKINDLTNKLK